MNEVKQKALEHYDRMINWVEKKIKEDESFADTQTDFTLMLKEIKEHWMGAHCPYCADVDEACPICPLRGKPPIANYKCCNNLWYRMDSKKSWKDWLHTAKKVRKYIEVYG